MGVTTIETLILSVMCSQGIPIWTENCEYAIKNCNDYYWKESFIEGGKNPLLALIFT